MFFLTYELIKKVGGQGPAHYAPLLHMGAAATGELVGKGLKLYLASNPAKSDCCNCYALCALMYVVYMGPYIAFNIVIV